MSKGNSLRKQILAALFAALICVGTMVVQVNIPFTNGYFNLGDCFILLCAWLLGPIYGMLAGGIGSALADFLSGYTHYVPGTLIIKGLMGLVAALVFRAIGNRHPLLSKTAGAFAAEAVMVVGYFLYAWAFLDTALAAASSIPANLLQAAAGIVAFLLLSKLPLRDLLE